jgi:hypothetical protein
MVLDEGYSDGSIIDAANTIDNNIDDTNNDAKMKKKLHQTGSTSNSARVAVAILLFQSDDNGDIHNGSAFTSRSTDTISRSSSSSSHRLETSMREGGQRVKLSLWKSLMSSASSSLISKIFLTSSEVASARLTISNRHERVETTEETLESMAQLIASIHSMEMAEDHEVIFVDDSAKIQDRMALIETSDLNFIHLPTVGNFISLLLSAREKTKIKTITNNKNIAGEADLSKIEVSVLGHAIKTVATYMWEQNEEERLLSADSADIKEDFKRDGVRDASEPSKRETTQVNHRPLSFSRCETLRRSFSTIDCIIGLAVLIISSL